MTPMHRPSEMQMIPLERIEVLNPRERNNKVFDEIVANIKAIGLKKPITVTRRSGPDGADRYLLVCGEGRLKAFRSLGQTNIPALVVTVSDEDAFIMSLAENIARRHPLLTLNSRSRNMLTPESSLTPRSTRYGTLPRLK